MKQMMRVAAIMAAALSSMVVDAGVPAERSLRNARLRFRGCATRDCMPWGGVHSPRRLESTGRASSPGPSPNCTASETTPANRRSSRGRRRKTAFRPACSPKCAANGPARGRPRSTTGRRSARSTTRTRSTTCRPTARKTGRTTRSTWRGALGAGRDDGGRFHLDARQGSDAGVPLPARGRPCGPHLRLGIA